jgi:hypothetical protein
MSAPGALLASRVVISLQHGAIEQPRARQTARYILRLVESLSDHADDVTKCWHPNSLKATRSEPSPAQSLASLNLRLSCNRGLAMRAAFCASWLSFSNSSLNRLTGFVSSSFFGLFSDVFLREEVRPSLRSFFLFSDVFLREEVTASVRFRATFALNTIARKV